MNRVPPFYGAPSASSEWLIDPEAAVERHWAGLDAAYEIWRDDQVLNKARNQILSTKHERPEQF